MIQGPDFFHNFLSNFPVRDPGPRDTPSRPGRCPEFGLPANSRQDSSEQWNNFIKLHHVEAGHDQEYLPSFLPPPWHSLAEMQNKISRPPTLTYFTSFVTVSETLSLTKTASRLGSSFIMAAGLT